MTLRIMLVDDDADYRLLVRLALEEAPDLVLAAEAASAGELGDAIGPEVDLVLLDASLPGAIVRAAALPATEPGIRVVLTSSLPSAQVADAVVRARAVGSLAKDIPIARLPDAIRELGALVAVAERSLHTARALLPAEPRSARTAREVLLAALGGWADEGLRDAAALLVSELVTNGVRHAVSDVDVRIAIGPSTIRVEIGDRSPVLPVVRTPAPTDTSGRGMRIVEALSLRWGVEARRTGKCVWFELPRPPLEQRHPEPEIGHHARPAQPAG